MALAPAFPGTDWIDPKFAAGMGSPLGLAPRQLVAYVVCAIVLVAVALAIWSQ